MVNYNDKVWKDLREFMSNAVNSDGGTAYNAKINKKSPIVLSFDRCGHLFCPPNLPIDFI